MYGTKVEDIFKLVDDELARANKKFPLFSSDHEAFAVIQEEVEETEEAMEQIKDDMATLWGQIRGNEPTPMTNCYLYQQVFKHSMDVIQEAVQIAAMARKGILSNESRMNQKGKGKE